MNFCIVGSYFTRSMIFSISQYNVGEINNKFIKHHTLLRPCKGEGDENCEQCEK